jgi:cytidylate kinase
MLGSQRIAIDGPAGSGKSTIGEGLARRLGYLYIDTGAIYRAVAWMALQKGVDPNNGKALGELAQRTHIAIHYPTIVDGRQYTVTVNGHDVTWDIRDTQVTRSVSLVSSHPEVRSVLIAQQRALAQKSSVVMVGRDIGAIVLPDADLKIYLTASLAERARRRYAEIVARMGTEKRFIPTFENIKRDIAQRDMIDHDNMNQAPDAILIETDHLTVQQVLNKIAQYIREKV